MFARLILLTSLAAVAAACSPKPTTTPEVQVESAWVRPALAAGGMSAGYLTIKSEGGSDRLLRASSEVAARVTLHSSTSEGGIARMRALPEGLSIQRGETVKLEPGGTHLMLEQLKRPLKAGETVRVTLTFQRSGTSQIEAQVSDGPEGPADGAHGAQ